MRILRFPPPKKTDHHDKDEILLKVALNTIIITPIINVAPSYLEDTTNILRYNTCMSSYPGGRKWTTIEP